MKAGLSALRSQPLTQALWHYYDHPEIDARVSAIGALRYDRFYRRVRVREMILRPSVVRPKCAEGRGMPAEITVHAWDDILRRWQLVLVKSLPWIAQGKVHHLKLESIDTRCLKVACLRHHPVPPNMTEKWASPYNVPYGTLADIEWRGEELTPWECDLPVAPPLRLKGNRPRAPRGMTLLAQSDHIQFTGPQFAVGFSLRRPMLTHLGWDSAAGGKAASSLLFHRAMKTPFADLRLLSGPLWNTLDWDCHARLWGGEVTVAGNVITYRNLHPGDGLSVNAEFEVRPDGMNLRLAQSANSERETLECDAWRFMWNGHAAVVATQGMPRQDQGRTGAVDLPAIWGAPGFGNLSIEQTAGDPARLQVDSWRLYNIGWSGIVFGHSQSYPQSFPLGHHKHQGQFELRVAQTLPKLARRVAVHPEIRRNWGPGLMFRAELGGFSNNALSTNCHLSQTGVTDLAAYTAAPKAGPAAIELARYTATMALKDGRGYGDSREWYQDSDPSLLNMAGRIHQVAPRPDWLEDVWPFVRRTAERILAKIDRRGLVVSPLSDGTSGLHHGEFTVSNAWDCVNFGHYDAYSNAETYRAFRNVLALVPPKGEEKFRARLARATEKLKSAYAPCFYNPKTGWLGSWRDKRGDLHDYGHYFVNAPACLYGLVTAAQARRILGRMEAKRSELGIDNFRYGLPTALLPVRRLDYLPRMSGQGMRDDGRDGFGLFCNGCVGLVWAHYTLRAMDLFGFKRTADQMAREILEGYAQGLLAGGIGSGIEFYTPEGIVCGYEGSMVMQSPIFYALAQHYGMVKTFEPEFWGDYEK